MKRKGIWVLWRSKRVQAQRKGSFEFVEIGYVRNETELNDSDFHFLLSSQQEADHQEIFKDQWYTDDIQWGAVRWPPILESSSQES